MNVATMVSMVISIGSVLDGALCDAAREERDAARCVWRTECS